MSRNYVFNTGSGISLSMTSNQNVGFHTQQPSERLEFADGNAKFDSNVYVMKRMGVSMSNPTVELDVTGDAHVTGDFVIEGDMQIYNPISVNGFYVTKNSNYSLSTALSSAVHNINVSPSGTIFSVTNTSNDFRFVVTSNLTDILRIPGDGAVKLYRDINITGDIIPNSNITYNLGSTTHRFKDLYLSGNTINLDGVNISKDASTGNIKLMDSVTSNMIPVVMKELQFQDGGKVFKIKYDSNINKMKFVSMNNGQEIDDISIPNVYTSNNCLGIGISNPQALLHVNNDAIMKVARIGSYPSDTSFAMFSHSNVSTATSYALLQHSGGDTFLNAASTKSIKFRINNNEAAIIDSTGKLGIGNISPLDALHVIGNIRGSSNIYASNRIGIATLNPAVSLEINGNDAILLPKGGTSVRPSVPIQGHMRYNTDTNTFEGYGVGSVWGSLGGVKDTNQDTYISTESYPTSNDDNIVFYNSNIERMRLTKAGLVGIGTSAPSTNLEVNGSVKINSNLTVSGNIIISGTTTGTGAVGCGAITSTGAIGGTSLNVGTGAIISGAITSSGASTFGSITGTGIVGCGAITSTGAIGGTSLNVGTGVITSGAITSSGASTFGSITGTGTVGCGAITSTGAIGGTSLNAGTGAVSGGSLNVGTGAITSGAITSSGASKFGSITGTGTVGCGAITSTGAIGGTSLNVGTGVISGGSLNVGTGAITSGAITSSGASTFGSITGTGIVGCGAITSTGAIGGTSLNVGTGVITSGAITSSGASTFGSITGTGTISCGAITSSGAIYASGDITALSDRRYKGDIKQLEGCLYKVSNLVGVSYIRNDYKVGEKHIGLIAQEVKEVIPEAVSYDKENDRYGLNYGCLIAPLIEAIKEMRSEYSYSINELRVEHSNTINELRVEHSNTINELRVEHSNTINELRSKIEAQDTIVQYLLKAISIVN
jgi:hypothetical protein